MRDILKRYKFRRGMYVTCKICGYKILDARLQFDSSTNAWYICQNIIEGIDCQDKLGYKHSWCIGTTGDESFVYSQVSRFKLGFSLKERAMILRDALKMNRLKINIRS